MVDESFASMWTVPVTLPSLPFLSAPAKLKATHRRMPTQSAMDFEILHPISVSFEFCANSPISGALTTSAFKHVGRTAYHIIFFNQSLQETQFCNTVIAD